MAGASPDRAVRKGVGYSEAVCRGGGTRRVRERMGQLRRVKIERACGEVAIATCVTLLIGVASASAQNVPSEHELPTATLVAVRTLETLDAPMQMPTFALAETAQGDVFVAGPSEILTFDATGVYRGLIGRQGAGPGEFSFISTLGIHGDTLWVGDAGLRRVTRFLLDGSLLETVSPRMSGAENFRPLFLGPDRSIITGPPEGMSLAGDPGGSRRVVWNRWQSDDQAINTLAVGSITHGMMMVRGEGGVRSVSQPFDERTPISYTGAEPYAIAASATRDGDQGTIVVQRIHFDGASDTAVVVDYRPTRITSAMVDSVVHETGRTLSWRPGAPEPPTRPTREIAEQIRSAMYVPDYRPPLSDLVQGVDGIVWIGREASAGGQVGWIIAKEAEGPLARIELPVHQRPMAIVDGYVWLGDPTPPDVGRVVKYRISFDEK